ncbi:MAG: DUF4375 domain-containing protein [Saprospiraceae bacterium]
MLHCYLAKFFCIIVAEKPQQECHTPNYFSLDDGNQEKLILYSEIPQEELDSIQKKYSWDDYNKYDNRLWEYMTVFFDDVVSKSGIQEREELWLKLNRPQKVFWTFLAFSGDTDNGGIYQFLFNKPEFVLAADEMWKEIGMDQISSDYQKVLEELSGKKGEIAEIKETFKNGSQTNEERWIAFSDGYKEFESAKIIEDYYYEDAFKKECHKTAADYIETHLDKFRK